MKQLDINMEDVLHDLLVKRLITLLSTSIGEMYMLYIHEIDGRNELNAIAFKSESKLNFIKDMIENETNRY